MNINCSGNSSFSSSFLIYSPSFSTAKSQIVNRLSSDAADSTLSELGANWMDVIGSSWNNNSDKAFFGYLLSQILIVPSSAPDAIRLAFTRFQEITLTSVSCALISSSDLFLFCDLISTIWIVLSHEQEAKIVSSVGDHYMSSTEPLW